MTISKTPVVQDRRTITGWALLIGTIAVWFGVAYAFPPFGVAVACIHMVCAPFDMMMNGSAGAEFAPFNLAGAVLAGAGATLGMS